MLHFRYSFQPSNTFVKFIDINLLKLDIARNYVFCFAEFRNLLRTFRKLRKRENVIKIA